MSDHKFCCVDGLDEANKTVYEYHGCYWHKHFCKSWYNKEIWEKTMERERNLRSLGYNVVSITSCEWFKTLESKNKYTLNISSPERTMDDVLQDVKSGKNSDL